MQRSCGSTGLLADSRTAADSRTMRRTQTSAYWLESLWTSYHARGGNPAWGIAAGDLIAAQMHPAHLVDMSDIAPRSIFIRRGMVGLVAAEGLLG